MKIKQQIQIRISTKGCHYDNCNTVWHVILVDVKLGQIQAKMHMNNFLHFLFWLMLNGAQSYLAQSKYLVEFILALLDKPLKSTKISNPQKISPMW